MRSLATLSLAFVICSCMQMPSTPVEPMDVTAGLSGPGEVSPSDRFSNDLEVSDGSLEILPCIQAFPAQLQFGAVACDQFKTQPLLLRSCSDVPVSIFDVSLSQGSHGAFDLDLAALVDPPTPDAPYLLMPHEEVTVAIGLHYVPPQAAPADGRGGSNKRCFRFSPGGSNARHRGDHALPRSGN